MSFTAVVPEPDVTECPPDYEEACAPPSYSVAISMTMTK